MDISKRMDGLQAARGVAALSVVLTHAMMFQLHLLRSVGDLPGIYGVALFFVISGYIMVKTTGEASFSPIVFMKRRFERIAPLYYIASAVLALCVIILPYSFRSTTLNDPMHIVRSFLFFPSYAPRSSGDVFPFYKLGWTLNLEMFFYILFSFFSFTNVSRRILAVSCILVFMMLARPFIFEISAPSEMWSRPVMFGFILGMCVARVQQRNAVRVGSLGAVIMLGISAVAMGILGALYEHLTVLELSGGALTVLICAVISAIQIAVVVFFFDKNSVATPRWLIRLGNASYSIYLFHMFAVVGALKIVSFFLPDAYWFSVVVAVIGSVGLGLVVYHFIEAPIVSWFVRNRRSGRSQFVPSFAWTNRRWIAKDSVAA